MSHLRQSFESFTAERGADPVQALREQAFGRFRELGFPTTKDEDWRFTNVAPIAKGTLALGRPSTNGVGKADVERLGLGNSLVFVDGHYRADLSSAPAGVSLATVRDGIDFELHDDAPAFVALNTAFLEDGACVEVEGELVDPLHVLFIGTDGRVCHPRNLYHVKRNGSAEIVETYVSLGTGEHWTNAVGLVSVSENAELKHTRLQLENETALHTSNVRVSQARDSRYTSNVVTLGGRLVRNDVTVALCGEGVVSTLNGLFMTRGTQHVDNHTRIEHRRPHGESHELYKGVLDDRSSGVFTGRIHVFEDAQQTDAYQSNANLLLADTAVVDTKPQLEIYADDVKCSHGAVVGQLDQDALFYLRSRGLPEPAARSLLVRAFSGEITERLGAAAARERVEALVALRMPGGDREA
ncbi:MAG: Fe-S cluster assembly protein SufD [Planctomycetota bacterium]